MTSAISITLDGQTLASTFHSAIKICQRLCPSIHRRHISSGPADKICSPEMDAPISAGESSLVGRVVEGPPSQRQGTRGSNPRLNCGRSGRESNGIPKLFAAGPQRENGCVCRTECAVARDIFGKGRCGECSRLIWNPVGGIGLIVPCPGPPQHRIC